MRILVVSHRFPPRSFAGTEVYALEAARRVAARGHEVHVLAAWKEVSLKHGARLEREFEGLPVVEFVDNLFDTNFRATWDRPGLDERLGRELDRVQPDLVHVHHLLYLSTGLLEEAHKRGIPVIYTLHDAWLGCARFGHLRHADGSLCEGVDPRRCGTCLPELAWRQSDTAIRAGKMIAGLRGLTGLDLLAAARRLRSSGPSRDAQAFGGKGTTRPSPPARVREAFEEHVRVRGASLRTRSAATVTRFISPSRWLAQTMIEWGLPPERVHTLNTGVDRQRFEAHPREPRGARLRIRFLGTLVPHKGAHVLLEAWEQLPPEVRATGELVLFGPQQGDPAYVAGLRAVAGRCGATLAAPLDRDGVAEELARTDLLVVPSQWYENRPMIMLEAFAAGVPVLCTDLGGMRELVEDGVQGYRFSFGDSLGLRERLSELLGDPARLADLDPRADLALMPDWESFTDQLLVHYTSTLGGPSGKLPKGAETDPSAT